MTPSDTRKRAQIQGAPLVSSNFRVSGWRVNPTPVVVNKLAQNAKGSATPRSMNPCTSSPAAGPATCEKLASHLASVTSPSNRLASINLRTKDRASADLSFLFDAASAAKRSNAPHAYWAL